jgi:phosphatidylglycerol:prolipoprotein diacylglycerol transferase
MKMHHMAAGRTADIVAPAIAIGHSIGRIGCFFAGCCYGQTCDLPWAVTFTDAHSLAPTGVPLHPTQLYAVFGNLLIFVFLMMFRPYKRFAGQLFLLYIMLYGLMRALIEVFRGDFRGDFIFGILSVSQFIGLSMALIAAVLLVVLRRRSSSPQKEDEHA